MGSKPYWHQATFGKIIFTTTQQNQSQPDQKQRGDQNPEERSAAVAVRGAETTSSPTVKTPDQK